MKEWFLSTELIEVNGFPNTTNGINQKAKRGNWKTRKASGKGASLEYHISNFTEEMVEQLREKFGDESKPESNVADIQNISTVGEWVLLDVYDVKASAGGGCFIENENIIGTLPIPKELLQPFGLNDKTGAVIHVHGDSMEPTLSHGDKIVIDIREQIQPVEAGVYVISVDGSTYVKRLIWDIENAQYDVVSDNPQHKTFSLDVWGKDKDRLKIVGRVVAPVMKRIF